MDDQKSEILMLFGWAFAIIAIAVLLLYPYKTYEFTGLGISDGVNLYACKYSEPAPMGIVDYGVTSYGNVYNISTNSVEGSISLNNLLTNLSNNNNASIQLNVNLFVKEGNKTQAYFLQNVILLNTMNYAPEFIDNVWNESGVNTSLTSSLIKGNGTVSPSTKNYTYYEYQAENQTGDNITLKNGQVVYLRTNSSLNKNDQPDIIFSYNDGYGWINYDNVSILTNKNVTNSSILISGFNYTPSYNFYSAGLIIGGPGDGYNTTLESGYAELSLSYWNGNNFQNVEDAYDFGCNTEEGINDAAVNPLVNKDGLLYANISSSNNDYLGTLWSINSSNISVAYINSSISNLSVSFDRNGSLLNYSLKNGIGEFTLSAGRYIIKAYSSGKMIYNSTYNLKEQQINYVNI